MRNVASDGDGLPLLQTSMDGSGEGDRLRRATPSPSPVHETKVKTALKTRLQ